MEKENKKNNSGEVKKKLITLEEAKEVWEKIKDNEFVLIYYSSFEDYWKECQRINNLPANEWLDLINEYLRKIEVLKNYIKK